MTLKLSSVLNSLQRTPSVLNAQLRNTSPALHRADEGPNTWSPLVVLGHLVHGEETDWIPRARLILQAAERSAPPPRFEPYDRFAHFERFADWTLDRLLDRFAELRRDNLATLAEWNLTDAHLALPGEHPELALPSHQPSTARAYAPASAASFDLFALRRTASTTSSLRGPKSLQLQVPTPSRYEVGEKEGLGPVTLENLLAAWVVHDLGHIVQISRVMAKTYTNQVGPWPEYLRVLGR